MGQTGVTKKSNLSLWKGYRLIPLIYMEESFINYGYQCLLQEAESYDDDDNIRGNDDDAR